MMSTTQRDVSQEPNYHSGNDNYMSLSNDSYLLNDRHKLRRKFTVFEHRN